jgi:hypoxanthine phosphoribosyltransferase
MTHLFQIGNFKLHSGKNSNFKIECDVLSELDWGTLAYLVSSKFIFSNVIGIPRGGLNFAEALKPYASNNLDHPWLIVDDVLNTGGSMEEGRVNLQGLGKTAIGVIVFARGPCPDWIHPMLQFWDDGIKRTTNCIT